MAHRQWSRVVIVGGAGVWAQNYNEEARMRPPKRTMDRTLVQMLGKVSAILKIKILWFEAHRHAS